MMNFSKTKRKIAEATIAVMRECDDIEQLSIRRIAAQAGVGIGLINYHFKTKQNLIFESVRFFIGTIIAQWHEQLPPGVQLSIRAMVVAMLQATARFLADYPRISRISILNDLNAPDRGDNTMQTVGALMPLLMQQFPAVQPQRLQQMVLKLVAQLQWFFLRHQTIDEQTGFNFFEEQSRQHWIEHLVDELFISLEREGT